MNQRFDVVQPVRVGECSQNKVSVGIRIGIILDWEESDLSGAQQSAFQHTWIQRPALYLAFWKIRWIFSKLIRRINNKSQGVTYKSLFQCCMSIGFRQKPSFCPSQDVKFWWSPLPSHQGDIFYLTPPSPLLKLPYFDNSRLVTFTYVSAVPLKQ